jgi:hypothetical protein
LDTQPRGAVVLVSEGWSGSYTGWRATRFTTRVVTLDPLKGRVGVRQSCVPNGGDQERRGRQSFSSRCSLSTNTTRLTGMRGRVGDDKDVL